MSSIVQSLLFVVVYGPYEVGDKVIIDGINDNNAMVVKDISVTTSTFESGAGKRIKYANYLLAQKAITNLKRSTTVNMTLKFTVGHRTSRDKLRRFKAAVEGFLRKRPADWKPSIDVCVDELSLTVR